MGGVDEDFAYVTTTGRRTGLPREIEIWFAHVDGTVYLMSGGGERAQWVRNLRAQPRATVRVGGRELPGAARVLDARDAEDARARRALIGKYRPRYSGDLASFEARALVVAIDLD